MQKTRLSYWFSLGQVVAIGFCSPLLVEAQQKPNLQDNPAMAEMQTRLIIARAIEAHRELLIMLEDLSATASLVVQGYQLRQVMFSEDDRKRIIYLEKLAKKIRTNQGYANGERQFEKEILNINQLIERLDVAAQNIKKERDQLTRFEVSTPVVYHTNEIIFLAKELKRYFAVTK
jgi:hypothetical protein